MTITITGLYTYPIKSCGSLSHDSVQIDQNGLAYDRHWVVAEPNGDFITAREYPAMQLIAPQLVDDCLAITAPGAGEVRIPLTVREDSKRMPVTVWRDTVIGADEGDEVASMLSDYLGVKVRLFVMPKTTVRAVDPNFANFPAQVGFADGYPFLVASEESLADLNEKLTERGKDTVPMSRFRPNIVVSGGGKPFAEDDWEHFSIGDVQFDGVKRCARCVMTTIDPKTGTRPDKQEPLATLATYRTGGHGVLFGMNAIHHAPGQISVGDVVTVG